MMVAKAKHCCPSTKSMPGRRTKWGEVAVDPRYADQCESPTIEIDDQVFIQRFAIEIDLAGDPDSADSAED